MKTIKSILILSILLTSFISLGQVTNEVCDCPKPTKDDLLNICHSIYVRESYNGTEPFTWEYQRRLWEIACVNPLKDTPEEVINKIQCFWNKYRADFTCDNYVDSLVSNKNIIKFCLERGFTAFVTEAVKKYHLDMNFTDKDGKTVLDCIIELRDICSKRPPVDEYKIKEYNRFYDMLRKNGAKHANELQ